MRSELVHVVSLTQAYRAKELLGAHGIAVNVLPSAKDFSKSGCGYSILITGDLKMAHALLYKAGITVLNS